jgi:hypothetical protein
VSGPVLRALTESGAASDDPSEDLIFELLNDIERGDEQFVIIERTEDLSGQTYAQAIKADAGGFLIERVTATPISIVQTCARPIER